jgi:hypothetical protein
VKSKVYLGDAVYIEIIDSGDLRLTTEDGVSTTNVIYINDAVLEDLIIYLRTKGKLS